MKANLRTATTQHSPQIIGSLAEYAQTLGLQTLNLPQPASRLQQALSEVVYHRFQTAMLLQATFEFVANTPRHCSSY
jgi:hypothetical protein